MIQTVNMITGIDKIKAVCMKMIKKIAMMSLLLGSFVFAADDKPGLQDLLRPGNKKTMKQNRESAVASVIQGADVTVLSLPEQLQLLSLIQKRQIALQHVVGINKAKVDKMVFDYQHGNLVNLNKPFENSVLSGTGMSQSLRKFLRVLR